MYFWPKLYTRDNILSYGHHFKSYTNFWKTNCSKHSDLIIYKINGSFEFVNICDIQVFAVKQKGVSFSVRRSYVQNCMYETQEKYILLIVMKLIIEGHPTSKIRMLL